jgi:2'-5' RNA ligase
MSDAVGIWEERHSFAPDVLDADAREAWAGDRERYFVFLVDVTDSAVHEALSDVRAVLAEADTTTAAPPEYYHVTLKQVGCLRDPPDRESDVTGETLESVRRRARDALADVDPFTVALPRLNLFERVVFCEVREAEPLVDVHHRLCDLPGIPQLDYEREAFTPHVSLGHFRTETGLESVFADLEPLRAVDAPALTVDAVELVEVPPAELYPSFETVERYEL